MLHFLTSAGTTDMVRTYGLWVVFGMVMVESMGLPIPGETVLVSAAVYAAATRALGIRDVVAVAALAAIVGDNLGYLIGRSLGVRLLLRYGSLVGLDGVRLRIGRYLFLRHGGKIVFFGRFVAVLRAFAALLAGANRMPWLHFLVMNALGGICWASVFGIGAYLFGEQIKRVTGPVSATLVVAGIAAVVAGTIFLRRHERELSRRADAYLTHHAGRLW